MARTRTPFQGVVTTGIYCRQGCPATPKEANVRPFAFAAAAESNGFRPCLRCRPDTMPGPAPWVAPSELVCRALSLISDGWLDTVDEDQLARKLGVSGRHLRRLFDNHVGASPGTVARSRRVHFARRLLIETDLTVGEIGFAAGFGSVRQMNRAVQEVFRMTPTELRQRRQRKDRLPGSAGLEVRLPFRPPLDWRAITAFLGLRAIPGVEAVSETTYARTVSVDGQAGVIELEPAASGNNLVLRVHLATLGPLIHIVDQARRIFDLDADPRVIDAHLSKDELLARLVAARPGLRVPGRWDSFETGVRAIVGQHVSVAAATKAAGRLAERFGRPAGPDLAGFGAAGLRRVFPEAAELADARIEGVGLTRARADTLRRFASDVAANKLTLDTSVGLDALVTRLCEIPGIGPWTAQYIAMRACGEPDAFPSGDLGLRRAAGGDQPAPKRDLEAMAERWRPWRAYAAMHLWMSGRAGA